MTFSEFSKLESGSTITLEQLNQIYKPHDSVCIKDNSKRGLATVFVHEVTAGDRVNNGTYFVEIVKAPPEKVVEMAKKKLAYNQKEFAEMMGISVPKARELMNRPGFPSIRNGIGPQRLIPAVALEKWFLRETGLLDDIEGA